MSDKTETAVPPDDWDWLGAIIGPLDDDFIAALNENLPQQERPELDALFNQV